MAASPRRGVRRLRSAFVAFITSQAGGGVVLMAAALIALALANSPLSSAYFGALHLKLGPLDLHHWVNDGLMALFFLLVGLEMKRELTDGQLQAWSARILPGVAALGGIAAPALIYAALNRGDPQALNGWSIPAATDIAFALGVLALVGRRAPASLKIFLTALAIIDDMGAVLIIALFYSDAIWLPALGGAALCLGALIGLNRLRVTRLAPYLVVGAGLWGFTLASGVHATLAGVALAMTIPIRPTIRHVEDAASPCHRLEHILSPWVGYLVVPVFGFANAGLSLAGLSPAAVLAPVPLGVALGLFAGKQVGVFAAVAGAVGLGLAPRPHGASWLQLYGVSVLCGVGFTMSLFIGALAFDDPALVDAAKLGVLTGSILSGLVGWALLRWSGRRV